MTGSLSRPNCGHRQRRVRREFRGRGNQFCVLRARLLRPPARTIGPARPIGPISPIAPPVSRARRTGRGIAGRRRSRFREIASASSLLRAPSQCHSRKKAPTDNSLEAFNLHQRARQDSSLQPSDSKFEYPPISHCSTMAYSGFRGSKTQFQVDSNLTTSEFWNAYHVTTDPFCDPLFS